MEHIPTCTKIEHLVQATVNTMYQESLKRGDEGHMCPCDDKMLEHLYLCSKTMLNVHEIRRMQAEAMVKEAHKMPMEHHAAMTKPMGVPMP